MARTFATRALLPLLLLLLWWACTRGEGNFYVPTPVGLFNAFLTEWIPHRLLHDAAPSIVRLLCGFALSGVIGIGLGLFLGRSEVFRQVLEPILEFMRAIPVPVLVPVVMLLSGIDDDTKVLIIAFGSIWPILINTIEGVRGIDPLLIDTAGVNHIAGMPRLLHITLPAASPQILAGLRQSVALSLILMVISEMFASTSGLGFSIIQFQRNFAIPEMWAGIVVLGLIGIVLTGAFAWIEHRLLNWYRGLRATASS